MGEMVAVFIKPDVGLELKVTYSDSEDRAGKFVVTGPKRKLDILKYVAQGIDVDGEIDGVIGPMTPITLPDDVKESAGIPLPSTKFAFLYPLSYFKSRPHSRRQYPIPSTSRLLLRGSGSLPRSLRCPHQRGSTVLLPPPAGTRLVSSTVW